MHAHKKIVPFLTFLVVANPEIFKLTRKLAGNWIASADGLPTTAGLILHAVVFVLLSHFLWGMFYGRKSGYAAADGDSPQDDMAYAVVGAPAPSPSEAVPTNYSGLFSSILGETGMNNFAQ
jgi:hypothetical protein